MLDFADVFKIAPTLQQMQIPALSEALRSVCSGWQSPTARSKKLQDHLASEQQCQAKHSPAQRSKSRGHPHRVGCATTSQQGHQCPQSTATPASYGKNNLCAISWRLRRDKSPPLCISSISTAAGVDLGPIACREFHEEGNGTFLFSGEKHLLWHIK